MYKNGEATLPVSDGMTVLQNYYDKTKLYINGESMGYADSLTENEDYGDDSRGWYMHFTDLDADVINDDVLFELQWYDTGPGCWPNCREFAFMCNGAAPDVDGDGENTIKIGLTWADGVYNGIGAWTATAIDPIYQFNYLSGGGPSTPPPTGNYSYNETIFLDPWDGHEYQPITVDFFFNDTNFVNYLTVEYNGVELENYSIEWPNGNLYYTPLNDGVYYFNATRSNGTHYNQVAGTYAIVSVNDNSDNLYIYAEYNPVTTGSNALIHARNSVYTDFDSVIRIYNSANTLVKEEYLPNSTSDFELTWKPPNEGYYLCKLMLDKEYDTDPTLTSFYLYARNEPYVANIDLDDGTPYIGQNNIIDTQHAFAGSSDIRLWIWSETYDGYQTRDKFLVNDLYQHSTNWQAENYIGNYQAQLWYGGFYKLAYYNFTVSDAPASTSDNPQIFEDINDIWESGAHIFGMDEDSFKMLIGAIVIAIFVAIPALLMSDKGMGYKFALVSNSNVYIVTAMVGLVANIAFGLWPLWTVFIIGIVVVAKLVFKSGPKAVGG